MSAVDCIKTLPAVGSPVEVAGRSFLLPVVIAEDCVLNVEASSSEETSELPQSGLSYNRFAYAVIGRSCVVREVELMLLVLSVLFRRAELADP